MIFNVNIILWTIWDPIMFTQWMYQYYDLYLACWWLNEPKYVAECLIVNIYYQHMLCLLTD
jgi:hypothetical protein